MDLLGGAVLNYFVSYYYQGKNGSSGLANIAITRDSSVSGWEDILSMVKDILSLVPDMEVVIIINWRRFEDPE